MIDLLADLLRQVEHAEAGLKRLDGLVDVGSDPAVVQKLGPGVGEGRSGGLERRV